MNTLNLSVIGDSHMTDNIPMQDYSVSKVIKCSKTGKALACIGVVCDGHGDRRHFRSEIGSALAGLAATHKLESFFDAYKSYSCFNGDEKFIKSECDRLKLSIIVDWQRCVEEHWKNNPPNEGDAVDEKFSYDVARPYGTTLIAVLLAEDYYLALMLGDGAAVKFYPEGCGEAQLLEFEGQQTDFEGPHGATDSMCGDNNFEKMFCLLHKRNDKPLAFGLCTDGMSEAFSSIDALFKRFCIYVKYWAEQGEKSAKEAITKQLVDLSKMSAMRDDVSVAIITNKLAAFDTTKPIEEPEKVVVVVEQPPTPELSKKQDEEEVDNSVEQKKKDKRAVAKLGKANKKAMQKKATKSQEEELAKPQKVAARSRKVALKQQEDAAESVKITLTTTEKATEAIKEVVDKAKETNHVVAEKAVEAIQVLADKAKEASQLAAEKAEKDGMLVVVKPEMPSGVVCKEAAATVAADMPVSFNTTNISEQANVISVPVAVAATATDETTIKVVEQDTESA